MSAAARKSALGCPNGHTPMWVIDGDWDNPDVQCSDACCAYRKQTSLEEWNNLPRGVSGGSYRTTRKTNQPMKRVVHTDNFLQSLMDRPNPPRAGRQLRIYHLTRKGPPKYGTWVFAIVCAATEESAKNISPDQSTKRRIDWKRGAGRQWVSSPDEINVRLLGMAAPGVKAGLIDSSFLN